VRARTSWLIVIALALVSGACASRAPVPRAAPATRPEPAPVDVTSLVRSGCFRCLESAFESARSSPEAAFQVALLLTLRAKELGLPFERWMGEATSAMPAGAEWQTYLEIASSVRIDPLSGDREAIMQTTLRQRRPTGTVLEWRAVLAGGHASPLVRAYLDLTLACSLDDETRAAAVADAEQRFGAAPLIQYRMGTCQSLPHLAALRDSHPDFVDADLPLGRNALDSAHPDQEGALRRFRSAAEAFPESPVIWASIGAVHQDREEWSDALEAYDTTLALVPTHRDALLGRAVALSNLSRHDEAIAAATRLLELGDWFIGGGYFWRAWNEYHLGALQPARVDLDEARTRGTNAATLALSGLVAWRQRQLTLAEAEFQEALRVDAGQCESAAYLGGVQAALERWADAAASWQHARQCFELSIALRRTLIEDVVAGPGTAAGKAGQIARHEKAIAEAEMNRDEARENEERARARTR
jgi:hypothetical protein